jgi:TolB-like protein
MKCIKIVSFALIFVCICIAFPGAQTPDKQKIIIYYFNDESPTPNYRYYSYIIPDSLSAELKNKIEYEVTVLPVTFKYITSKITDEEKANTIAILTSRGKEVSANFSVIGSYRVEKNTINIKTQICNVATGDIVDAAETSEKIGALIYEIIDRITVKINKELQETIEIEKEKIAISPYKNFYSSLQNIFLCYSYNFIFFTGDWENLYNDTSMSKIYIGVPVSKIHKSESAYINKLYFAPTWQFFSTNNLDLKHTYDTYLSIYMGGISLSYIHSISPLIDVSITIQPGIAYSDLYIVLVQEGGPFAPYVKKNSYDPFLSAEVNAIFYFYSIGFTGGFNYNRLFYKGNDLTATGINFGILYKL